MMEYHRNVRHIKLNRGNLHNMIFIWIFTFYSLHPNTIKPVSVLVYLSLLRDGPEKRFTHMIPILMHKPALTCVWLQSDDNNDSFYHIMTSNTLLR